MARLLVANEQGGNLAQLRMYPEQPLQHRTLAAIVVHTVAVFLCQQEVNILQPFVNMLNNPAMLVVSGVKVIYAVFVPANEFTYCNILKIGSPSKISPLPFFE